MAFFEILKEDKHTAARAGILHTAHGDVPTPIFMPVATRAALKAVPHHELDKKVQVPILLSNTYHLYLRPGTKILKEAGGLHRFMAWEKALLTDSGGFQVYSLQALTSINNEGITFRSHIDGSPHLFTPEKVVEIQRIIGSDIMMVLDECVGYPCSYSQAKQALERTHLWAQRSKKHFLQTQPLYGFEQYQFGIVQGSIYKDLRKASVEFLTSLDFDGYAIGGLAVGESEEQLYEITGFTADLLPKDKPRYLMGVGTPYNILRCIALGIDMFDCVMPTRNARHGGWFFSDGIRNLSNAKYAHDFSPIDPNSELEEDKRFSKAYIRHLYKTGELLVYYLASLHNLWFYLHLTKQAHYHILQGTFYEWYQEMLPKVGRKQ